MAKQASASGKGKKKTKKQGGILRWLMIVLLLLLALLVAVYLLLCNKLPDGAMADNTLINGVELDGMSRKEAEQALQADFEQAYKGSTIIVELAGESYPVCLWDDEVCTLSLNTQPLVDEAMNRGHGDFLYRGIEWMRAQLYPWEEQVVPMLTDREGLLEQIRASGIVGVDTHVESGYTIEEDHISIVKGEAGVVADEEALVDAIVYLVNSADWPENSTVECPTQSSEFAALDLQQIYDEVYVEPQDATLDRENNFVVVDSVTGVSFDLEAAREALENAADGETVTIEYVYTKPEIDTSDMENNLFKDLLGTYTTSVSGSSGRKGNVKLAAEYCDGTILLVGDTFSYNGTVGQRTKARGFSEAPAYQNGQTVQELGGGICQTSSTLYAACLYANLEIVNRVNHSFASSYIGLGMDATVSWGGPDFEFRNNTQYPIKVVGSYANGKVTMSIYGTKTDDITVKITSKTLDTIPYSTETRHDKSLAEGESKVITTPYTGYKVQTYRELYDGNGNLISSEPEAYSYYKARNKVIAVG